MSAGVSLAWATEAFSKGIITEKETLVPLAFGNGTSYQTALHHLAIGTNEFYQVLSRGTMKAAERYGGGDFACVLGRRWLLCYGRDVFCFPGSWFASLAS